MNNSDDIGHELTVTDGQSRGIYGGALAEVNVSSLYTYIHVLMMDFTTNLCT